MTKVLTFGCRLNSYEGEVIRQLSAEAGLDDAIIVNSCAVTAEAERQTRQAIRRARRANPDARIFVTGCAAEIEPARYEQMEEVDAVIGNREKLSPDSYAALASNAVPAQARIESEYESPPLIEGIEGRARAFVPVQNGCDHRCTFCIIPFGRGASRSVPAATVARQLQLLADNGCHEVVISGVDITSYGADLPHRPTLGGMLREVLTSVPDMPRLRISSIDPAEIDDDLMALIAGEPRLMPHFHLSVQAGHDLTLKRMRRRHCRDDVIALTQTIRDRRPDAVFGADFIAGFPTETDAMFEATMDLVDEAGLTFFTCLSL